MKTIKVLGTGCAKCKATIANAEAAIKELGIEAEIIKVEDIAKIMEYDVMQTPAVVIDEVVKTKGKVVSTEEFKALLTA
ncbi:MAG: thioredoxin family protein [Chloroherpetonaceae bacterium]